MGLLDYISAGYLLKRLHNKFNPPTVIPPDGIQIVHIKSKGMNEYEIIKRIVNIEKYPPIDVSKSIIPIAKYLR